jgi:hypothetical protein
MLIDQCGRWDTNSGPISKPLDLGSRQHSCTDAVPVGGKELKQDVRLDCFGVGS